MMKLTESVLRNAAILGLFAILGTSLVALTKEGTEDRIADNERQALLRNLEQVVSRDSYDNDMLIDLVQVTDPEHLGSSEPVTIYRARKQGQPVAAVIASIAPDGYAGPVKLLVGIGANGVLTGVRVLAHKETPGLGDAIELEKSDWVLGFAGRSLVEPTRALWKVKKDGGVFDQFTGATITPRIVIKAIYKTLLYFELHRDEVFQELVPAKVES